MLWIGREVAWLRLGSCTDQVISAVAATPDRAIRPRPLSSRTRRVSASRIEGGKWPTSGMTRSIADMLIRLTQRRDQPVQRFGGDLAVLHQRPTNEACARIETVRLELRQIAARHHAYAGFLVEFHAHRFVVA